MNDRAKERTESPIRALSAFPSGCLQVQSYWRLTMILAMHLAATRDSEVDDFFKSLDFLLSYVHPFCRVSRKEIATTAALRGLLYTFQRDIKNN